MKKVALFTLAIALTAGMSTVQAQNDDFKHTLTAGAGYSLTGAIFDAAFGAASLESGITSSVPPAIVLTYDHGLTNWFSLGVAGSTQPMKIAYDGDISWDHDGDVSTADTTVTGNWDFKANRYNVGLKVLFHYANSGKVDLYSGVRPGLTGWSTSFSSDVQGVEDEDVADLTKLTGSRMSFGVIPFGLRGYFTDNIGINFEINIGSPYVVAGGIAYRM